MANVTAEELWDLIGQLRGDITLLDANLTSIAADLSTETAAIADLSTDMNTLWLIVGGILVFFMQGGFAMLEVGNSPVRATKNMLLKNVLDSCVACIGWWVLGYGLAFGVNNDPATKRWIGTQNFFLKGEMFGGVYSDYTVNEGFKWSYWFFQWAFCGASATIISGAVGVRITLTAYFFTALAMSSFVYPINTRWLWSPDGWMSPWRDDDLLLGCGVIDFAGSGVVHTIGGTAAIVLCIILGPRLGRFIDGQVHDLPKQSAVLQVMGLFFLWTGWYGFNSASTLYIVGYAHVAAKICVTTTVAACSAGCAAATLSMLMYSRVSHEEVINGILSGLVAITSGCAVVEPEGAFVLGIVSAVIYMYAVRLLIYLKIDDAVDALPVHLFNGVWGVLGAGLFASSGSYAQSYYADRADHCCGALYGCGYYQFTAQLVAVLVILAWVGGCTFVFGYTLHSLGVLRVSKKHEAAGIDETHGGVEVPEHIRELLKQLEDQDEDQSTASGRSGGANSAGEGSNNNKKGSGTAPASPAGGRARQRLQTKASSGMAMG